MKGFEDLRTVRWDEGRIVLIDQTKLPQRVSFVTCSSVEEVAMAIRKMVVRGAPAIGVAVAMGLALTARRSRAANHKELLQELKRSAELLRQTRPTAVNLSWALRRMLTVAENAGQDVEVVKNLMISEAVAMANEDVEANIRMGDIGAALIDDGDKVITHCNRPADTLVGRAQEALPPLATVPLLECLDQPAEPESR